MIVLVSRKWRIINLPTEISKKKSLSSYVRIMARFPQMGELERMTLILSA